MGHTPHLSRREILQSIPLLGPGSPHELVSTGLPMLIVQGGADPYGTPDQPQGLSGPGSVTLPQSARKPPVWPWHQSRR